MMADAARVSRGQPSFAALARRAIGFAAGVACLAIAAPRAARAADSPDAIEEIVVTAQRLEESAQKTPLSLTPLSDAFLAQQSVDDATDLDTLVPGLHISGTTGGIVEIAVRGIGSTNNSEVGDPAVAFNQDGIYLARSRAVSGLLYDLERIEVLRGPQGTLYGRNATAGSINVISNKPGDTLEGAFEGELGDFGLRRTELMANVPVADVLSVRGAFASLHRQGFIKTPPFSNYGDVEAIAGRVWALVKPHERLSILLGYDAFHDEGGGAVARRLPVAPGSEKFTQPMFAEDGSSDHRNHGFTAQADLDLGPAVLTYIGSDRRDRVDARTGTNIFFLPELNSHLRSAEKQRSHELRVAHDSERLKLVAGVYAFRERDDVTFSVFGLPGIGSIHFIQPEVRVKSRAAFGQASFALIDALRLTGGIRYTSDTKSRTGGTYLFLQESPPGSGNLACFGSPDISPCLAFPNQAKHHWSNTSFRIGADADLATNVMAWASVASGYKAGGYNDGPEPFDTPYDPERITAYEAGLKSRFWGGRVQANLSLFRYDYRDLQVSAIAEVFGQPSLVTINAAKARNYGGELEFSALVGDGGQFDGSLAYLHARFRDFLLACGDQFSPPTATPAAGCPAGSPAPADYSGNRLAKAPDWTFSIGYQHGIDLPGGFTLLPRLQTHYESAKNLDYHGFPVTDQRGFWKSDAMLTLTAPNERWSLQAYVRNLTDKAYLTQAAPMAAPFADRTSGEGFWGSPRRYGIELSAHLR